MGIPARSQSMTGAVGPPVTDWLRAGLGPNRNTMFKRAPEVGVAAIVG